MADVMRNLWQRIRGAPTEQKWERYEAWSGEQPLPTAQCITCGRLVFQGPIDACWSHGSRIPDIDTPMMVMKGGFVSFELDHPAIPGAAFDEVIQ